MSKENEKKNFSNSDKSESKSNLTHLTNPEDVAGGFSYADTHTCSLSSNVSSKSKIKTMNFSEDEKRYLQKHGYTVETSGNLLTPMATVKDGSGKVLSPEEIMDTLEPFYAPDSSKKG